MCVSVWVANNEPESMNRTNGIYVGDHISLPNSSTIRGTLAAFLGGVFGVEKQPPQVDQSDHFWFCFDLATYVGELNDSVVNMSGTMFSSDSG